MDYVKCKVDMFLKCVLHNMYDSRGKSAIIVWSVTT